MNRAPANQNIPHRIPWSRDELILALDLYMKHPLKIPPSDHQDVMELSFILEEMARLMGKNIDQKFRSPDAVRIKLTKFIQFDAHRLDAGIQGPGKGSKEDECIWDEFSPAPRRLATVADAIRAAVESGDVNLFPHCDESDYDPEEAEEGKILTRIHRLRERQKKLVEAKKKETMKRDGRLSCEVCDFNFADHYGPTAINVIDIHHTRPLHTLRPGDKTKLDELALLCSNCHRMVHASKKWMELDDLRALLAAKSK